MESVNTLDVPAIAKQRIYAQELLPTFLEYADKIDILSLDCFDTLLWRKTALPTDVFYDMQNKAIFQKHNVTAFNRIDAEERARLAAFVDRGSNEVMLEEIYRSQFQKMDQDEVQAIVDEELKTEIETCYGFTPVCELIRTANARGKKIIIVSNTYLREAQLKKLLQSCLPADVFACIDRIFCSCEFRKAKNTGLFVDILQELKVRAETILHIGDNQAADFLAPRELGLHALHFLQLNDKQEEIFRMQNAAATLINPAMRYHCASYSPYRGIAANAALTEYKPETTIGYFSLGPVMYAFAHYIQSEIEELKRAGKKPKVLFLMRDAYLFSIASDAFMGESVGMRVRISRFMAIASSFRSKEDVHHYLSGHIDTWDLATLCKQLLLPTEYIQKIVNKAKHSLTPSHAFCQQILHDDVLSIIIKKSAVYREKLKKYLLKNTNIEPGDTVMLIDIGYIGRIQNTITSFFLETMQVSEVTGRYLMLLNMPESHYSRSGLVDSTWCDSRAVRMLCESGYLLEELCCNADNSVNDFDDEGNPIFGKTGVTEMQRVKVKAIHDECMRFIHDAKKYFAETQSAFPFYMLRDSAVAEMGRRVFFPTTAEIEYLKEFFHDVDGGSEDTYEIYNDVSRELNLLRKQGLTFDALHSYGLRAAGLELSLASMLLKRFPFEIKSTDMNFRRENVKVVMRQNDATRNFISSAAATHDGYFTLLLPFKGEAAQVALMFGLNYQFVQIHSAELIRADKLLTKYEDEFKENVLPAAFFSEMIDKGGLLFECSSANSAMMIALSARHFTANEDLAYRVIFRPVVMRSS